MTVQARWNSDIQCHVVALDVLTDEEDHVGFVEKRHEERVVPILVVFHLWIVGLGFFFFKDSLYIEKVAGGCRTILHSVDVWFAPLRPSMRSYASASNECLPLKNLNLNLRAERRKTKPEFTNKPLNYGEERYQ